MTKISVIIPVYNTAKYLTKCLDSVCSQTLKDIEVICINDCSTDNSLEILQNYAANDSRIKIINFTENKGAAAARNQGIDIAQGEYLGFIDSDDFVDLDFYEKLYNKAKETGAEVVKGNIYNLDVKTGSVELTSFYDINNKIHKNKINFLYGFTSAIYLTDFIKTNKIYFPEKITHFEDPYFSIGVILHNPEVDLINEAKYYYVKHDESACANSKTLQKTQSFAKSVCLILDMINQHDLSEEDYGIYTSFLLQQIIPWCSDLVLSDDANKKACTSVEYIFQNAKYGQNSLITAYFLGLKQEKRNNLKNNKNKILQELRQNIRSNHA